MPALHNMLDTYGRHALGASTASRTPSTCPASGGARDWLGIDQGPIIIMIENYLNGAVWQRYKGNADVQRGLARAGFTGLSAVGDELRQTGVFLEVAQNSPNPFRGRTTIAYRVARPGTVILRVYDLRGRCVRTVVDDAEADSQRLVSFDSAGLASGIYSYCLEMNGHQEWKRCTIIK